MGPGFRNLGNTCFLNATLQCLSYLPPLAQHLLKGLYAQVCVCTLGAWHGDRIAAGGLHRPQSLHPSCVTPVVSSS